MQPHVCFLANTSTQTMGPRPAAAAAAATPAVRTVPQYKYAAGVRNPQQHLNAQPQVTMQQVGLTLYKDGRRWLQLKKLKRQLGELKLSRTFCSLTSHLLYIKASVGIRQSTQGCLTN